MAGRASADPQRRRLAEKGQLIQRDEIVMPQAASVPLPRCARSVDEDPVNVLIDEVAGTLHPNVWFYDAVQ